MRVLQATGMKLTENIMIRVALLHIFYSKLCKTLYLKLTGFKLAVLLSTHTFVLIGYEVAV